MSRHTMGIGPSQPIRIATCVTTDMDENIYSSKELDDQDVVVSLPIDEKKLVKGYFFKNVTTYTEPPKKIQKVSLALREDLTLPKFIDNFQKRWRNKENLKENGVELLSNPFKVCVVKDVIKDKEFLKKVVEEFNEIRWNKRSLDLYEFFQSTDLKKMKGPHVDVVYNFLKIELKSWIEMLTEFQLTDISATCSLYGQTDYLLVHDDQQEDRLIAFVLYFSGPREWLSHHGGALQLFSKDTNGEPLVPIRDIFPSNNQLVFFQVTNDSYHQVAEVLNWDDCRMSINGWFHTKTPLVFNTPLYIKPTYGLFCDITMIPHNIDVDLKLWIQPVYLDPENAQHIQKQMEEDSEISLRNFLTDMAWEQMYNVIQSRELKWVKVGPPNRRSYDILHLDDTPESLLDFLNLFSSQQFFSLLKEYTDLDLKSYHYELQKWTSESYSLLSDYDWSSLKELDLIFYLGPKNLCGSVIGGRTIYVAMEEEIQQALIVLDPCENCLNIVYRDSARVTKYISKTSAISSFYMLIFSYSE
ncbi:hypothetical protein FQA39_LY02608 [Lamprigera yunnana]|nr:hypothetical protein FQA39_LY02608 [Lamprigera yunnana]